MKTELQKAKAEIIQLKAKAKRDLHTANRNEDALLDRIMEVEKNSVSTEYFEETVIYYKKQIIKLKQSDEELHRLFEWLKDPNREFSKTKFTAGMTRNVAREFEFLLKNA